MSECKYSHLSIGDTVTIEVIGTLTCTGCGYTWTGGSFSAKYIGHTVNGSMADNFSLDKPIVCSSCGSQSKIYQEACGGNYVLAVAAQEKVSIK